MPYQLPPKEPDEDNWAWCQRAAASIPAEDIVVALLKRMIAKRKRNASALWSEVAEALCHGSGVSSAVVSRFLPGFEDR